MKQALKELEELKNFANRMKRLSRTEGERIRHEAYEGAYEGAIEIINNNLEGKS